jgi:hypothetical protein
MLQLKFVNPVFHDGLNTTVRLGTKWSDALDDNLDEPVEVEIAHPDGTSTGVVGVIEEVQLLYFSEIPQTALELEHDPTCHNLQGLYKAMKTAYGDDFHAGSLVSIVYFTLKY